MVGFDGYGQWTSSMGGGMAAGQQGLFNSPFTGPQQAASFPQSPGMSHILGQMGGGGFSTAPGPGAFGGGGGWGVHKAPTNPGGINLPLEWLGQGGGSNPLPSPYST